jgi:hypothetical protein
MSTQEVADVRNSDRVGISARYNGQLSFVNAVDFERI